MESTTGISMPVSPWIVHKFGGSSVADAECFRRVAAIVAADASPRQAVVLSACRGVTDALLDLVQRATRRDAGVEDGMRALRDRHAEIAGVLLTAAAAQEYVQNLDADCNALRGVLQTVQHVGAAARTIHDVVAGAGEIWSSRLFALFLQARGSNSVVWLDARRVVVVEWGDLGPVVQWDESSRRLRALVQEDFTGTLVIPGYVASDLQGVHTTLGRNGSDFSASIFGALLAAGTIQIWTDVDGVLSADPHRVPEASVVDSLSYHEAMELAYFGAKVIHPQTMAPAIVRQIPILIRNTFAPGKPGTAIAAGHEPASSTPVKGITSIDGVALLNVEGAGMIGVPGTANRLFGALHEAGISVILISQGSSEHSICIAVPAAEATRAAAAIERAFERELREGQIQSVTAKKDCSIVAIVGDGMAGTPGIAARLFGALAGAGVNVLAIAQGASERNISAVVDAAHTTRALRAVHAGFYLSPHTLSIGILGTGTVGGALLDQLAGQVARLRSAHNIDLRVRGLATSRGMVLADRALDLEHWRDGDHGRVPLDLDRFVQHVHADHLPHCVLIDCTANAAVAARYAGWLAAGIHVVTPNKKANSGPLAGYRAIEAARLQAGAHYLYETTVGAGLPIIQTLRDLRATGDDVTSIEGILSGTLAYLFNVFDGSVPFSTIVRTAKEKGYTEPDPRDDLSGLDVARKIVILGREMGLDLELEDVQLEGLVPPALADCSVQEFLDRLPEHDGAMLEQFRRAAEGTVLRYIGRLEADGRATVGIRAVDRRHAFANIALTDNVVRFATRRYCDSPLVVQGPGAGPEVTAAGVFADLLRVCAYLGAKL